METEDNLFENVEVVLTEPLYNLWSKARKGSSEHDLITGEDIRYPVETCLEVMDRRARDTCLLPAYSLEMVPDAAGSKNARQRAGRG